MKLLRLLLLLHGCGMSLVWGQTGPTNLYTPIAPLPPISPLSAPLSLPPGQPVSPVVPPPPSVPPAPPHHLSRAARALQQLVDQPKVVALSAGYQEGKTSDSDYWIAHRFLDPYDGSGWGWVRKKKAGWSQATWVALKENPGVVVAPFRHLTKREGDNNWEFKFWGRLADYKGYDAHLDERLPVFILEGYEVIGPANPLLRKPGPSERRLRAVSQASSRPNRPIQNTPDE